MIPIRELKSRERWVSCFPKALPMVRPGTANPGYHKHRRFHLVAPPLLRAARAPSEASRTMVSAPDRPAKSVPVGTNVLKIRCIAFASAERGPRMYRDRASCVSSPHWPQSLIGQGFQCSEAPAKRSPEHNGPSQIGVGHPESVEVPKI